MNTKDILEKASKKVGEDVKLEGLMRKIGRLKKSSAKLAIDVLGFDYIVHWDNSCYEFYAANPPLIGITQPVPVPCPYGIAIFNEYKIDYKKAVDIFLKGNWGDSFTSISLSKPLHPDVEEPYWYFLSNIGVQVMIGADTGKVILPK